MNSTSSAKPTQAEKLFNELSRFRFYGVAPSFQSTPPSETNLLIAFDELVSFISTLVKQNCKKQYDTRHLAGCLLVNEESDPKSISAFHKCVLLVVKRILTEFKSDISSVSGQEVEKILMYNHLLHILLIDATPTINFFMRKEESTYNFVVAGKAPIAHSWEHFRFAKQLFYSSTFERNVLDNKVTAITLPFAIRSSIEYKIWRILGINIIYDKNKNPLKTRHDLPFEALKHARNSYVFRDFDFDMISKAYNWTNDSIHTGWMPYIWQSYIALQICEPLFASYKEHGKSWNINNAVTILDHGALKAILTNFFGSKFPDKVPLDIVWLDNSSIEAVIQA